MRLRDLTRTCPTCQGAGEITIGHWDPQCERSAPCPNIDCDRGRAPIATPKMTPFRQLLLATVGGEP
jgi:hypothetical protein